MSFAFVGRVVQSLKGFYNGINPATLTGAIDVVIVKQEDGTYLSSPFHVRFGKLGVLMLSSQEKVVDIEVNGVHSDLQMKLGEAGEAFFVQEIESEEEDVPAYLATSPLPSGMELMERGMKELHRQAQLELGMEQTTSGDQQGPGGAQNISDDSPQDNPKWDDGNKPRRKVLKKKKNQKALSSSKANNSRSASMPEAMSEEVFELEVSDSSDDSVEVLRHMYNVRCASSPQIKDMNFDHIQGTTSHRMMSTSSNNHPFLTPYSDPEASPICSPIGTRPSTPKSDTELERHHSKTAEEDFEASAYYVDNNATWQWGELPKQSLDTTCGKEGNSKLRIGESDKAEDTNKPHHPGGFMSMWSRSSKASKGGVDVTDGIYLDDLTSMDDPEMAKIYLGRPRETEEDAESGRGLSLPQSPNSVEGSIGGPVSFTPSEVRHLGVVSLSLCGGLNDPEGVSLEKFMQKVVTFEDLAEQPNLTMNPDLVVKIHDKFYNWTAAGPMVLSQIVFQRTLPEDAVKQIEKEHMPKKKKKSSWFSWGRGAAADAENGGLPAGSDAAATTTAATTNSTVVSPSSSPSASIEISTSLGDNSSISKDATQAPTTSSSSTSVAIPTDSSSLHHHNQHPISQSGVTDSISSPALSPLSSPPNSASSTPRKIHDSLAKRRVASEENTSTETDTDNSERDSSKLSPPLSQPSGPARFMEDSHSHHSASGDKKAAKHLKKTLRLTSDQITKLNLKPGHNEISFSVTTQYQGTARCVSHVYLWNYDDKIVISDIDGTITKSDVLGQILPIMGRDWSQSGVAQLFTRINQNGYKLIYLSARAIGQSRSTKDLLKNIKQGGVVLPDGPVFLNPTSLFSAFHREVILKNPEEFKISCLKDIGDIFPSSPFYAGFGNKFNDVVAYRALEIPNFRIFTVNPAGQLRHDLSLTFLSSYSGMSDIVDHFFPSLDYVDRGTNTIYNPVNYWRQPIPQLSSDELTLLGAQITATTTASTSSNGGGHNNAPAK